MLCRWFSLVLAYNNSSSHFTVELITLRHMHVLLDTLILLDRRVVASTLSEDGSSLLYSEEQGKVSCHW